ncbi:MAG: FeoB-associated Cys-rich membrane protein [Bacteroidetes bacterium]|nr:FeoB-associated Cys-rich membrane protein [Bacteroidota bacterium]
MWEDITISLIALIACAYLLRKFFLKKKKNNCDNCGH